MKRLHWTTCGAGILLIVACAKGGGGSSSDAPAIAGPPPPTTPAAAAATSCPAAIQADHDAVSKSCHTLQNKDQIGVCISNEKGFLVKYPGVNCQISSTTSASPETVSATAIQSNIDMQTQILNASQPIGGGTTPPPPTQSPAPGITTCDAQTSADYAVINQITHAQGTVAGPCVTLTTVDNLKTCQAAYVGFTKKHPQVNCLFVESTGKTTAVSAKQILGIVVMLQNDIESKPPTGGTVVGYCDAKSSTDFIKMTTSCHETALVGAADIPRLKSCITEFGAFNAKYPKENCRLPPSIGPLMGLIISTDSLNEQIKVMQQYLDGNT